MKLFFALCFSLFITAAGWSAPFGLLSGVENRDNPHSPALLLRKIVAGEPVCAVVHNLRSGDTHTEAEYLEMLRQNYQAWFNFALQTVKESGREKEFEDLLPALRTQVVVQKDCAAPDILFFILPAQEMEKACRSSAALACVDNTSVPYKLYFSPKIGPLAEMRICWRTNWAIHWGWRTSTATGALILLWCIIRRIAVKG